MFGTLFGKKRRSITIAPTWSARDDKGTWPFTIRIWASKERKEDIPSWAVQILTEDTNGLDAEEKKRLAATVADFIADDDSGEKIEFQFPGDAKSEIFGFEDRTDFNGVVIGNFSLADERVKAIAERQGAADDWLTIEARGDNATGTGRIKLLQPNGRSVVSDIDDTIRVTEIREGRTTVLRRTFLEPFVAVPGMQARYGAYGNAVDFHYLSGGPWQLYRVLAPFLIDETGFPVGTFHMRSLPKNPFEPDSWRGWRDLLAGDSTMAHKKSEITALFRACPDRRFILIGDSGEKDPEIYMDLRNSFPGRTEAILIRDVSGEAGSERLSTVTVIPP